MATPLIEDPLFERLIDPQAPIENLGSGCVWSEGPAWIPRQQAVIWSDIPSNRIMRWTETGGVEIDRTNVGFTNGRTLDLDSRLVVCSHGHRRIERVEHDGTITALATHYQGARLNSPNDVVVKSDGSIWFTDPPYGILSDGEGDATESELSGCFVFRFEPASGVLTVATDLLVHPNGLAFSVDESILYASDTSRSIDPAGNHHIMAFDVEGDSSLTNPRVFAEISPGLADGFRVDRTDHVFTSAEDGIHVLTPEGHRIGKIPLPEVTSNCVFGGPDGNDLFITASTSLYRIRTKTTGAPRLSP
ncbi:MAG TPA: SMP-30/gluconolactonase/LRE family protein [Acidimicrobiia bacterium]|nr:SMP-30/gluconolactonase/LRE family protein [Acidimicrobiia bacterium]